VLAPGSQQAYLSALTQYSKWGTSLGLKSEQLYPITSHLALEFLHYKSSSVTTAYIQTMMAHLEHYNVAFGFKGFAKEDLTQKHFKAISRCKPKEKKVRPKVPITAPMVKAILKILSPHKAEDIRFAAMLTIAFLGALRPSVYSLRLQGGTPIHSALTWHNWVVSPNRRKATLWLQSSKTYPQGVQVKYFANRSGICAIAAMERHKQVVLATRKILPTTYMFQSNDQPVTYAHFRDLLAKHMRRANLQVPALPHSLRRGLATSLFLQGASPDLIKTIGRWNSSAYQRYIKLSTAELTLWITKASTLTSMYGWLKESEYTLLSFKNISKYNNRK